MTYQEMIDWYEHIKDERAEKEDKENDGVGVCEQRVLGRD